MNRPEIICEPLCSFGYAAMIILSHKGIEFEKTIVTKVSSEDKKQWLQGITPLKRLPVLKAESSFIFGTCAICEYIDEAYPHSIQPKKAIIKALNRSWMEFSVSVKKTINDISTAQTEESFEESKDLLQFLFYKLEKSLTHHPYFNGEKFSVVDAIYAPLLTFIHLLNDVFYDGLLEALPRLHRWYEELIAVDDVKKILNEEFRDNYLTSVRQKNGYLIHSLV